MTTVDAIYTRHQRSLMAVDHADDVVLFSLRLALEELAASTNRHTPDRQATIVPNALVEEVRSLEIWLNSSGQAIEGRTTITSAINTLDVLNERNEYQARKIDELIQQLGDANLRIMELQADMNRRQPNGAAPSTISNQQSPINNQSPPNPSPAPLTLDLSSLAPDELQQVAAVQSGERLWRTLDKPLRMKVASLALRQLAQAKGERITQREWEAQRPWWIPSSGSLTYMYGTNWDAIPQE